MTVHKLGLCYFVSYMSQVFPKTECRFFSWGGVRLSPLGMLAAVWPVVPAPDDRWWVRSSKWNENWQGKLKYPEKTCSSPTLSTKNPIWPDLGSNLGCRGGKLATNCLSYGMAFKQNVSSLLMSCVYVNIGTINSISDSQRSRYLYVELL
jgi:hypothetical protein